MIIDFFTNYHLYSSMHQLFPLIAEYTAAHDLSALEKGKYEIGRGIKLSVDEYTTKPKEAKKGEYHRIYIDIQMPITGSELCGYAHRSQCSDLLPYDDVKDAGFVTGTFDFWTLTPASFAIFYPHDVHMPGVCINGMPAAVKKAIFKIPV